MTGETAPVLVHGTAIAVGRRAALIVGPSGGGKSDLALRCLVHPRSTLTPDAVLLVADDQVLLERRRRNLLVRAPATIKGKLEVRGIGVLDVPFTNDEVALALVVELAEAAEVDRLPDPMRSTRLAGVDLPLLRLSPFEASAASKLLLTLGHESILGRSSQ